MSTIAICNSCQTIMAINIDKCPSCGARGSRIVDQEQEKFAREKECRRTERGNTRNGIAALGTIIGLAGIITVFFIPPIGITMLVVSGLLTIFKTK